MARAKESTNKQQLVYACTAQWIDVGRGRKRKGYRFNVIDTGGEAPRLLCIVNDICSTEADARELEQLFRRNDVALCHVVDVLEDWVAGRH
ncbi:MAG: DUF6514 family protein [Oscillospiraceae bacterium]|jgi:hypothetical protein|nr:DUF6514 family protein [Oscillospiraceae bacterium]